MASLNPLVATDNIRDTYLRYIKTLYPFQEEGLRDAFWRELATEDRLVKGPLLEVALPFVQGASIQSLVAEGILHPLFEKLCSHNAALPYTRPLYLHQDKAIRHVVDAQRNLIVATGTGSGKTESFIIPVLDSLLREQSTGTLSKMGVRVLLLYPMNALANDQLKRLRRILRHYPAITFGRYTGETKPTLKEAEQAFIAQFPDEPRLPNELICRDDLQKSPPHILITNYAMLEYLLVRPQDCVFFDGEAGDTWRFIVLDEAHIYDGATGIEIAMLLRRLKDRVVMSQQGRLQCIATSATLGEGAKDFPQAAEFAKRLFGEPFTEDDVVEATRLGPEGLGDMWGAGTPALYNALWEKIEELTQNNEDQANIELLVKVTQPYVPTAIINKAQSAARRELTQGVSQAINVFLYHILRGDGTLRRLLGELGGKPQIAKKVASSIFPNDPNADQHIVRLVDLTVRARPDDESLAILPARYHVFARALEGTFACLNTQGHGDKQPRVFLRRHEICPDCGMKVVELASCSRCGGSYIVGRLVSLAEQGVSEEGIRRYDFRQLSDELAETQSQKGYFLRGGEIVAEDEDEVVATGESPSQDEEFEPYTLCIRCGIITPSTTPACGCGASAIPQLLRRLPLKGAIEPRRCIQCGSQSKSNLIFRFLTGQDAPVSVLATSLYQQLPPLNDARSAKLPGKGRKLLIFADSRQDAAFFAPYLEMTYLAVLRRRLILRTLFDYQQETDLRYNSLVRHLTTQAKILGIFQSDEDDDDRRHRMQTWLMQELIALDRRLSLEGLGLLTFRLVPPKGWEPPVELLEAPWNLTTQEAWSLTALLLDTLRQQSAIKFPDDLEPESEEFAPRNLAFYIRETGSDSKKHIYSWLPASKHKNRRLDIIERLLAQLRKQSDLSSLEPTKLREEAILILQKLWEGFIETDSVWRENQYFLRHQIPEAGYVYQLHYNFWEWIPSKKGEECFQCQRCRTITSFNIRGICPMNGCTGVLKPLDPSSLLENHYRRLYLELDPIPFKAEEHTAQWTGAKAGEIQEAFSRGKVNALSCSTTFELGVDVGELQAVLMRNVPPTTANYIQRAGRAGRRTDSAAFALTYAQRRSHDLTHYTNPEKIVAGKIQPPRIVLTNLKIVRRHMQAVLVSSFFRMQHQKNEILYKNIGAFFEAGENQPTGSDLLREYACSHPQDVLIALKRLVPTEIQEELELENWGWLGDNEIETSHSNIMGSPYLELLDRTTREVKDDIDSYEKIREGGDIKDKKSRRDADRAEEVLRTIRNRDLLGFLASRNLLPKYGFPTDVVELKTNHITQLTEAKDVQLERDLRIAISEYAPGAQLVAAKRLWTGGGLVKPFNRLWVKTYYTYCTKCNRYRQSREDTLVTICERCHQEIKSANRGSFIIPEFGFIASRETRKPSESRPQRLYASRIHFAEYAPPQGSDSPQDPILEPVTQLSSKEIAVACHYSRFGKLALINSGENGAKFHVCDACGYAEKVLPFQKPKKTQEHINPRTGRKCTYRLSTVALGHEFLTDIVEIRIKEWFRPERDPRVWRSLLYALIEGASESLSIRRDDLDGTLGYRSSDVPSIFLVDNVPGGAGHAQRIAEELPLVFKSAYERVHTECCSPETSCYECLRTYRNQPFHADLIRGEAEKFLADILKATGHLI